ncbi:hypothetical protein PHLGIDRAFT_24463 [Phlebiopsis gigantea 11061_1 CR5-6]|uniref:Tubulin nucleotide-binding domain-like protein n=1 Tax=Phlebiopsis gigantea (strain 11061_1 CR5-6) TaxID=745531 RepID=A0A0C3NNF9_PHLG1|nr:hypothetical protein PHLGIDRAFT_24463 [Phlebiopsis gigantea 11061_1 CR5-6]
MREILYFQAGTFANFVGTHFWNAQESYFTYGEDAPEAFVDHDVSFREGLNERGESTFCPRVLLFDRKYFVANFGPQTDVYGEDCSADAEEVTAPWNGEVVEYRSDPISRSDYHSQLDAQEQDNARIANEEEEAPTVKESKVRYWSDYSRVFFHSRSIHRLPDLPEWGDMDGDWVAGAETWQKYDDGIQVINDAAAFGSFTASFLTRFRDDFTKLSCLSFPILSGCVPGRFDVDDAKSVKKALNDALLLQGLSELSALTVPIQSPTIWSQGSWSDGLDLSLSSIYQTSAILSTHLESVTLPTRLKKNPTDLSSIVAALSWRNDTLFATLQGVLPVSEPSFGDVEKKFYDFSTAGLDTTTRVVRQQLLLPASISTKVLQDVKSVYARLDVTRGFTEPEMSSYTTWLENTRPTPYSTQVSASVHAPAINVPTSYPRFFRSDLHPQSVKGLGTLYSTPSLAPLFGAYASVVKDCLGRHADVVNRMGLEADDIKELRDTLWALEDAYQSEEGIPSESEELGEDEEF